MKRKNWIVLGLLAAAVGVPLVLKLANGAAAKLVDVEAASLRAVTPSVLASGALTYESQVTLAPEVTGKVKEILVKEGDQVKMDQLLMRLDPAAPKAEIEQIEAQIRQSRLNIESRRVDYDAQVVKWKRYDALLAKGMIDANSLDGIATQKDMAEVQLRTSREQLSQSQAVLNLAREKLAKTEIRSPLNGKVTAIYVKVGETAVPSFSSIAGSQLMQVADTTSIDAEINVDETDIARVKVGAEARIVPAAFPDKTLIGKVDQVAISPRQQAGQNKSYPVRIKLNSDADVTFHPGMSCRAEVLTGAGTQTPVLAVPVQALRYEDSAAITSGSSPGSKAATDKSTTSVFVLKDGKVVKKVVQTGVADDAYIAVTKGLEAGETVVTGPSKILLFLKDGDKAAINTAPAAKPSESSASVTIE